MKFDSLTQLTAEAAKDTVQGTVFAQVAQNNTRTTKQGKPYLEIVLADADGSMSIKVWDNAPWHGAFAPLQANTAVAVTGNWQMNQYGMDASDLDVRPLTPDEEETMLSGSPQLHARQESDWAQINEMVAGIRDPRLNMLCRALLETFEGRFRRSGAARGFHHARRGGLVEHTAGVMRNADALCGAYPQLNRDLLLAGALFHDCGKMWENCFEEHSFVMPYVESGEMLGHITMGIEIINKLWSRIYTDERKELWKDLHPASEQVRMHLLHLVASHHGVLEYGSPVMPKTPEALILHHADDMDAKMEMFAQAYATQPEIGKGILQKKPPLPTNVVLPLPHYEQA